MCDQSEPGQPCGFSPCAEYERLKAELYDLKRKRIEDAARHERDLALNEYKMKNDDFCERRANQLRTLILALLSGKEAAFIGELEDARDRYFKLGMKEYNKVAELEAENAKLRAVVEKADALADAVEHSADLRESADYLRERLEELRVSIQEPWKAHVDAFKNAVKEMANRTKAFDELYVCTEYTNRPAMMDAAARDYQEAHRG